MSGELVPAVVVDAELVDDREQDVQELIEEWLDAGSDNGGQKAAHTRTAYRRDVDLWLGWCSRNRVDPLRARKTDVDAWIKEMAVTPLRTGRPPAKATLARTVSAISSLYDYLVDQDYVDLMPVRASSRPRFPTRSTTIGLSVEETVRLRAQARAAGGRDHAIIEVLVVEGLRVAELADLTMRSYSWNKGKRTLVVVGKGQKRRELVVERDVAAAVDGWLHTLATRHGVPSVRDLDRDAIMFPSVAGGRLSQKAILRTVRRLAKAAGIPSWEKLSPHSLRHTCATNMLDAGEPINVVQEQLGHEDIKTTLRYDRARGSIDRSGMGNYEEYLRSVERNMGGAA